MTGARTHASGSTFERRRRRKWSVVADQDPDRSGDRAARLIDPEDGVARQHPGAEPVGERDRRLGDQPRVERGLEHPGGHALTHDVGHRDVEVLVELGPHLGEVRVADAEQGQLLPEEPLVGTLLVAGQAPVEEGRHPFGGALARAVEGALVELGGGLVGVLQHLTEQELLGVEVVVQQAGRHSRRAGDRGHPDLGQAVADDAVHGGGEDPGARFRGRLLPLAGLGRLGCHGLHRN